MTPTRLRECLKALDWSQRGLARVLERQEGTVRAWARGALPIPDDEAEWLDKLARFHERNPPPGGEPAAPAQPQFIRKRITLLGGTSAQISWLEGEAQGEILLGFNEGRDDDRFRAAAIARATEASGGEIENWRII